LLVGVVTALIAPSAASAASYAPGGSNVCLALDLTVNTTMATPPALSTLTATVVALGATGQHVGRLHLDLEVQERTATGWVPFVTDRHALTYAKLPGSRLHRTWTLQEDLVPIDELLLGQVQMRVYGKFTGVCPGESFGPPLLFGLTAPAPGDPL
jgi:hypothetical protein